MIVCICKSVRERDIRELIDSSQEGLRMRDLRDRLGVSSECGKCARRANCLLKGCSRDPAANVLQVSGGRGTPAPLEPVSRPEPAVAL
ncbi:bacterioferritin-associated ferredoxin [Thioalkalivibrio sp. ALE9]|uniref:(2Fe-2S)-binding protein n=1 Tax=Thioalkalivibrio sp. ALE9 TaxID=1158169 RepID=UPI0003735E69|nr:(2Fe-2S)-binding protein [Thioalkalivibrio sp. ALE9]